MCTARSPSVFVERLNNLAAGASTPDDNEQLVKTYDYDKRDKAINALKGQFVRVPSISFHCKIFLGRDYW